jgi:hypothetical protein
VVRVGAEEEEKIVVVIDSGRRSDEAWLNGISAVVQCQSAVHNKSHCTPRRDVAVKKAEYFLHTV